MQQQFKCLVAIGYDDFTWQRCEVTAVITNGVCGSVAKMVEDQVKQSLKRPYIFVHCYSVTPI